MEIFYILAFGLVVSLVSHFLGFCMGRDLEHEEVRNGRLITGEKIEDTTN